MRAEKDGSDAGIESRLLLESVEPFVFARTGALQAHDCTRASRQIIAGTLVSALPPRLGNAYDLSPIVSEQFEPETLG